MFSVKTWENLGAAQHGGKEYKFHLDTFEPWLCHLLAGGP